MQRLVRQCESEEVRPRLDEVAGGLDGTLHNAGQAHRLHAQGHPAARDAGDVEQIVDQPRELIGLAVGDVEGPVPP